MTIDAPRIVGAELDGLLRREQARLHGQTWAAASAGTLLLGLLVVGVMSRAAPTWALAAWGAGLCAGMLGRVLVGLAQRRAGSAGDQDPVWVTRHRIVSFLHGLVWSMPAVLLLPPGNQMYQTFLVLALCGICVSSLTSYAFDLKSSLLFCGPTLLSLFLYLLWQPDEISRVTAFTMVMFMLWVAMVAVRAYRAVLVNVALRGQENRRLHDLRRSHMQLERAEQLGHMGSFEWSPESGVLDWSDEHFRLWGLDPQSVAPTFAVFLAGVHSGDRNRVEHTVQCALRGELLFDLQYRVCWPHGEVRHIHGLSEVLFDGQGKATRVVGTVQDVTERLQAQAALADKQHLLTAMQATTPLGFWFINNQGVSTDINPAMCEILGRPSEVVLGREAFSFFDPDIAGLLRKRLAASARLRAGSLELHLRRPDGHKVHCLVNVTPIRDVQGEAAGLVGMFSDLTIIDRANAALGTAEFVVNSVHDMVSVIDQGGAYVMVNDAWCRWLGLARDQVLGRQAGEVLPALYDAERVAAFRECLQTGSTRVIRATVDTPVLGPRFLETTLTPLLTGGAGVGGVVAVTHDITDFENTRAALANSLENLRRTFNATTDGMFAYDASDTSGRLLFANQRVFDMWQVAPDLAARMRRQDIMDAVRATLVDSELEERRINETLALNVAHEDRLVLRDGRVILRNCVPLTGDGGPTRVWTFRDITVQERALEALRASEAGQRAIMDAFPGFVAVVDRRNVYAHVNARMAQLLGRTVSQIVGRHMREVLGEDNFREVAAEIEIACRLGRAISTRVYEQTAQRPRIDLQVTHVVDLGREPASQLVYAFGVDVTDRVSAENGLLLAKEDAERANQAKSAFLASVSHELKTPLNAILGFSQVLRSDPQMSTLADDSAAEIERAGQHLLSLVDDLIDLGRVEAGHLELNMVRVALDGVVNDSLSLVAPLAAKQGIRIVYSGGDARNAVVLADVVRLRQVIINLLSNAIKYNRTDGTVRVSCQRRPGGDHGSNAVVRVMVRDTGMGISDERAGSMFSAFDRLGAERGLVEGTGIGLVITRRLIQAMGGDIGFESQIGVGSLFWIDLMQAGRAAPPQAGAVVNRLSSPASCAGARILVAEDYAPNQAVLKLQLVGLGCVVEVVNDGTAALAKWSTTHYDLILTDLDMPLMGGLELARTVRLREKARGSRVPIIALSAAVIGAERDKCLQAGMDDVLGKPISVQGLATMLARWLPDTVRGALVAGVSEPLVPMVDTAEADVLNLDWLYQVLGRVSATQARALVATFLDAARSGLHEARRSGFQNAALLREMHRQQSSARTVGALRYAALAAHVEAQMRAGSTEQIGEWVGQLETALREVEQATLVLQNAVVDSAPAPLLPEPVDQLVYASVLVVDDDPVVLLQMTQMLGSIGLQEVLTARNGVEALRLMNRRRKSLDLVVCDLNMPEMDGVEMIRRFGQSSFSGALILMSGADEQILTTVGKLAALQGLTVLGQIHKPVTPQSMRTLLRQTSAAPISRQPAQPGSALTPQSIRKGIEAQEFSIWLQPKVNALTLQPVGVEALARWHQSDGSLVPPDLFIVMAERAGIIGELSGVLVAHALDAGARLHAAGFPLRISINLSALWLDDLRLPDLMSQSVKSVGLAPTDIILEVTETGVTKDVAVALDVLTRLRLKGFGLSIDDFGIGYSSFEQLGRIPFTEMKIDRSFVNRGSSDSAARAILESSMVMAQKLKLSTVAEGVESEVELELMRDLGCDCVQGYLIARPMSVADAILWLQQRTARA